MKRVLFLSQVLAIAAIVKGVLCDKHNLSTLVPHYLTSSLCANRRLVVKVHRA